MDKTYIVIAEYLDFSVLHQFRSKKLRDVTFDWCQKIGDIELKHWGVTRQDIIDEESTYEEPTPLDGLRGVWYNGILIEDKLLSINIFILPDIRSLDNKNSNNENLYSYCSIVNGGIFTSQFYASNSSLADQMWIESETPWCDANEFPIDRVALLKDDFFTKLGKHPNVSIGKMLISPFYGLIYRIVTGSI